MHQIENLVLNLSEETEGGEQHLLLCKILRQLAEAAVAGEEKHKSHGDRLEQLEKNAPAICDGCGCKTIDYTPVGPPINGAICRTCTESTEKAVELDRWGATIEGLVDLELLLRKVEDGIPAMGKSIGMRESMLGREAAEKVMNQLPKFLISVRKALEMGPK